MPSAAHAEYQILAPDDKRALLMLIPVLRLADNLDALIRTEGPDTIAAMIVEPIQGAGGVILPRDANWLDATKGLRQVPR